MKDLNDYGIHKRLDTATVRFKDVSWPIKAAVVAFWIIGACWILLFLLNFLAYAL